MSQLVDFALARRLASLAAGDSDPLPPADELRVLADEAGSAVRAYTGLQPQSPLPAAEWVTRREWTELNLASIETTLSSLGDAFDADSVPGPVRAPFGAVAGAQLGLVIGYASRKVLGQYDFPLLGSERPSRLVFVAANVTDAERELGGGRAETLRRWIALHEVTHAVHFASAPWLAPHLRGLARRLLESSAPAVSPGQIARAFGRIASKDPRATLRELSRTDPLSLLAPPAARDALASTQATMAAIEGFAEHVMDAAAPALGEDVGELRRRLDARRANRPPLARLLAWLLGMELKLRQYRDGKRFCDEVVRGHGIATLNLAWEAPESLPTLAELADPERWAARVAPVGVL